MNKIRNSNLEIRNNFKMKMTKSRVRNSECGMRNQLRISNIGNLAFEFVSDFGFRISCFLFLLSSSSFVHAGHSRSGYLDASQSADGRYVVTASRMDVLNTKGQRTDHRWTFTWHDRQSGESLQGELLGLRTGTDDVFDPVNAHIFVAPTGDTFAVWVPQAMARSSAKKPADEDRGSPAFRTFAGFAHRLTIYKKTGEVLKQFDVKDFLQDADWQWLYFYGCQVYWLTEYEGFDTRSTPRSGYALYRISPDYTVLEFQIGANAEATHHAKQRGITPPEPRTVLVRLTDGQIVTDKPLADSNNVPVRPFIGELANKERPQHGYEPSLDPVRVAGRFIDRDKDEKPVRAGQSSPSVKFETRDTQ